MAEYDILKALIIACREADLEPGETIRLHYSGRNMFGRECLGLVVPSAGPLQKLFVFLAMWAVDAGDGIPKWILEMMDCQRSDNMGFDTVFYYPNVSVLTEGHEQLIEDLGIDQ